MGNLEERFKNMHLLDREERIARKRQVAAIGVVAEDFLCSRWLPDQE